MSTNQLDEFAKKYSLQTVISNAFTAVGNCRRLLANEDYCNDFSTNFKDNSDYEILEEDKILQLIQNLNKFKLDQEITLLNELTTKYCLVTDPSRIIKCKEDSDSIQDILCVLSNNILLYIEAIDRCNLFYYKQKLIKHLSDLLKERHRVMFNGK